VLWGSLEISIVISAFWGILSIFRMKSATLKTCFFYIIMSKLLDIVAKGAFFVTTLESNFKQTSKFIRIWTKRIISLKVKYYVV
jgi:hypothetical protein